MNWAEISAIEFGGNTIMSYTSALLILLIAYIVRKYVARFISKGLFQYFKSWSSNDLHVEFFQLFSAPLNFLIIVLSVYFAMHQLDLQQFFAWFGKKAKAEIIFNKTIGVLLTAAFTWVVLRVIDYVILVLEKNQTEQEKSDKQIILFAKDLLKVIIFIISVFFILGNVFSLNITSLIAGLGIGGLAIALAAQDTLANLFGSFIIFLDKPFKVGHFIHAETITGTIEKIGFRSTLVRTLDKSLLAVPNKQLVNVPLNNVTLSPSRRVRFTVGLTYNTKSHQIKKVCEEIREVLLEDESITDDVSVVFTDFATSCLEILVIFYVVSNDWDRMIKVKESMNYKIMEIVERNGCEFAFPTQTIHLAK